MFLWLNLLTLHQQQSQLHKHPCPNLPTSLDQGLATRSAQGKPGLPLPFFHIGTGCSTNKHLGTEGAMGGSLKKKTHSWQQRSFSKSSESSQSLSMSCGDTQVLAPEHAPFAKTHMYTKCGGPRDHPDHSRGTQWSKGMETACYGAGQQGGQAENTVPPPCHQRTLSSYPFSDHFLSPLPSLNTNL